ncbi:uncharacterized protein B0I36DRAFT_343907 [Microdochium trichocladiopsis]|uniref:Required for respiratory growth protein 9, mitochondrial n=1 Tax=Microdochium trichocladiopsis TaxID=1682393 RepID=A0A9P8YIS7_9PEZI|nr:uncharacterized protein B0I36DRAFT_343907 [Microdochium trichocladiopsis]KAH7040111.1 hypothetical protein B0I36DRAFT_343907 [Microdochium trichocladiopsis]
MSCSCRTTTLGIFVRSLTGLRVSNTTASHLFPALNPQRTQPAFRSLRAGPPIARQFGATALRTQNKDGSGEEEDGHASNHAATASSSSQELPVSSELLDRGMANGAILDLSPESISALSQSTPRYSDRKRGPRKFADDHTGGPKLRSGNSSQLYRRKILPKEEKTQHVTADQARPEKETWQIQKTALTQKFPEGWSPRKRLSPDALDGIRALHAQFPEEYTTEVLAKKFEVSAEAIRRILKSKWQPTTEEDIDRQDRWFKRGKRIWGHMAELGKKPPRRWRKEGVVRDPSWNQKRSGPRTEYPYMPQRPAEDLEEENESPHKKLGDNLV